MTPPEGAAPAGASRLVLSLAVSGDGMGAKLRIVGFDPAAWKVAYGSAAALRTFLESQGIAPEAIRDKMLGWIAESLSESTPATRAADLEEAQAVEVAQGKEPLHEEPLGLAFHKSYLANAEAIADLRRKSDAWGFEGLKATIAPEYWVAAGATVLSWQGSVRGMNGRDVFGAPIPGLSLIERLPPFGKSLKPAENRLIAVCEGALIVENGVLRVLGGDSLPTVQVVVAEDRMSANLVLGGNTLNDWTVTLDMVQAALREQGVLCMLPDAEIQGALNAFNHDRRPATLAVSRGRPPVPGEPERLVLLVDPEPEAPLPGPDGSIDFKAFSFFRTVKKGERLAKVLPPVPGVPGLDVHGREIPAPEARDFDRELGRNTLRAPDDPAFLIADRPGRLAVRMGVPEVVEVLDVSGDVSLKTGNIAFPGAVRVTGDVHSRMEIECGGDVEVEGTVEDSVIRTDGAIVIRGGVNGMGKGIIKSRLSSVTLGYLHNQRIESASHIVVYNEIIASQLHARKTITMRFGRYTVLGGYLLAGESMDLFNVGSVAAEKTLLEVGKDFEVEAEMDRRNAELLADTRDIDFLRDMEEQLLRVLRLTRGGSDEDVLLHKRTQGAIEILARRIVACKRELAELSQRLYLPGPCEIKIRGTAHPGTVLKYRDQYLPVPGSVQNRKWIFKDKSSLPPPEGYAIGA
ncbi:MAG TPA: FapA family protein [Fibrobacteria bacterium]|nr:FapA family protein [Fibrobacteria bacterium]